MLETMKAEYIKSGFSTNSVLNVTVSAWPSYFDSTNTKPVNLLTWLQSGKYAKQIEAIRKAPTKAERDKL